jgi:hypothetical protein
MQQSGLAVLSQYEPLMHSPKHGLSWQSWMETSEFGA